MLFLGCARTSEYKNQQDFPNILFLNQEKWAELIQTHCSESILPTLKELFLAITAICYNQKEYITLKANGSQVTLKGKNSEITFRKDSVKNVDLLIHQFIEAEKNTDEKEANTKE